MLANCIKHTVFCERMITFMEIAAGYKPQQGALSGSLIKRNKGYLKHIQRIFTALRCMFR